MTKITKKKPHIWDVAGKLHVYRYPPSAPFYSVERLEPGVNFFVLMLEQLGCTPHFSCEGHPDGFYVLFEGSQEIAEQIHACGFFAVEVEGHNRWSIRLRFVDNEQDRRKVLRWAAAAWENGLEPLDLRSAIAEQPPKTRKRPATRRKTPKRS